MNTKIKMRNVSFGFHASSAVTSAAALAAAGMLAHGASSYVPPLRCEAKLGVTEGGA